MKVIKLNTNPKLYSSNVYLLLGSWNRLNDVNALIDTGIDDYILNEIEKIDTGIGKKTIEKVILTHSHFDHIGGIDWLKKMYSPQVYAFNGSNLKGKDKNLTDGEKIVLADCEFTVIHTPGHSHDSICLYCDKEGILFTGDTPINIRTPGGSYSQDFINVLKKLCELNINIIYPGHNDPISVNPHDMLLNSLKNVRKSKII